MKTMLLRVAPSPSARLASSRRSRIPTLYRRVPGSDISRRAVLFRARVLARVNTDECRSGRGSAEVVRGMPWTGPFGAAQCKLTYCFCALRFPGIVSRRDDTRVDASGGRVM